MIADPSVDILPVESLAPRRRGGAAEGAGDFGRTAHIRHFEAFPGAGVTLSELYEPAVHNGALPGTHRSGESEPLWGTAPDWSELITGLRAFDERWGRAAEAASWSLVELFGVDPVAPRARIGRMGGAWLACLPGRQCLRSTRWRSASCADARTEGGARCVSGACRDLFETTRSQREQQRRK
jgi:hypothetical protein